MLEYLLTLAQDCSLPMQQVEHTYMRLLETIRVQPIGETTAGSVPRCQQGRLVFRYSHIAQGTIAR
jgi:hypothetical protein